MGHFRYIRIRTLFRGLRDQKKINIREVKGWIIRVQNNSWLPAAAGTFSIKQDYLGCISSWNFCENSGFFACKKFTPVFKLSQLLGKLVNQWLHCSSTYIKRVKSMTRRSDLNFWWKPGVEVHFRASISILLRIHLT